jgi:hypothetical protein
MEVSERHARARAIIRDTDLPVNPPVLVPRDASRDVARVVSDVSVLCPRAVYGAANASALGGGYASRTVTTHASSIERRRQRSAPASAITDESAPTASSIRLSERRP